MAECITLFARLLVTSSTLSTAHLPHITLSTHQFFCLLFSKNFNILSDFLSANRQPDREKTILAKVGFDAKRVSV
jgi:hypothetical protein